MDIWGGRQLSPSHELQTLPHHRRRSPSRVMCATSLLRERKLFTEERSPMEVARAPVV